MYGPYLFLIYVNCLYTVIKNKKCERILYVDDTNLIIKGKSINCIREIATLVTKSIFEFFSSLNLALNLEKTNYMLFNHEQTDLDLYINDVKIFPTQSCKFLGMSISSNLSWDHHIRNVLKNINKGIFVLRQSSTSLGRKHNLLVFNAFIQSHLSYGIILWGCDLDNSTRIQSVFRKQKRAIRLLNNVNDQKVSCRGLFKKDGLLTLAGIFIYFAAIFAKKHLSLHACSSVHNHNTRNKKDIYVKSFIKGDVSFRCVQMYNRLPNTIKSACSMAAFKNSLKRHLVEMEPYTIGEFVQ